MAERKLLISFGQSNSGPYSDIESWLPERLDLNLLLSVNRVSGSYAPTFTMPGVWPGYIKTRPLKGLAIDTVRYLTFWNPSRTGTTSYPGTTRTPLLTAVANTSTTLYVEATFLNVTNRVTEIVRKLNGKTYAVSAVQSTYQFSFGWNGAGSAVLTHASHGLAANDVVVMSDASGPTEIPDGTYYVVYIDANTFSLKTTLLGSAITVAGAPGAGGHLNQYFDTRVGSRLTLSTPMDDPTPQPEEEFTHKILSTGTSGAVNVNFGVLRKADASLQGVQFRVVDGAAAGETRIIGEWDPVSVKPTLYATDYEFGDAAVPIDPGDLAAGDEIVLEPQGGVAWDRWCYFLPWCYFETDLSGLGKTNPYPPGFDFPNQYHTPQVYSTDVQTPTAVDGTFGQFVLTVGPYIAWHCGGSVRVSEALGEPVYVLSCDFGGTSTAHNERSIGQETVAWYDRAQQSDWSIGRQNSCFARFRDELAAAKATAAAEGDTLKCIGIFRVQGDGDASLGTDPTYGGVDTNPEIYAEKFLESNRTLRRATRQLVTDLGFWDSQPEKLPWVQPRVILEMLDTVLGDEKRLTLINTALQQLAEEDAYAETFDPSGIPTWDTIHYTGAGLVDIERLTFDAWQRILHATDRSGELDLCNMALSFAGDSGTITSIDPPDGSTQAALCAKFYPTARDSLIEKRQWSFATKRKTLLSITSDSSAYEFCYVVPGDAAKIIDIMPSDAPDDFSLALRNQPVQTFPMGYSSIQPGQRPKFSVEQRNDGTRVLYSDLEDLAIRYTVKVPDTRRFPEQFKLAVAWQLAGMLLANLMKGREGVEAGAKAQQMVMQYLGQAAEMDANQRRAFPTHVPPWISAR